ncbi:hypothetical protein GCM10023321_67200 [Pseudonocardia eucalypti]|uniref:HTH hxlR-type domain-containing protein n=1 Tax=Pseudonocardia eucalypti TaxID=648755 RepID=A0ABP9R0Y4_9PSEU|nr:DNA-binding HxlR family transcriptional regulator [Pseudonocardia eucalypti]
MWVSVEVNGHVVDVCEPNCPSRGVLEHVTSRWGVLVLAILRDGGTYRFSELRRRVGGVSEKMLAQTLQRLERDGFVRRVAHPVIPPHVDYSLTPLGEPVAHRIAEITLWIEEHLGDVFAAREEYDATRETAPAGRR